MKYALSTLFVVLTTMSKLSAQVTLSPTYMVASNDTARNTIIVASDSSYIEKEKQVSSREKTAVWLDDLSNKRWFQATYLGAPLIVAGLIERGYDNKFKKLRNSFMPMLRRHEDNYIQYLPAAVMLGMKVGGVQGRSSWKRMLISDAISMGLMVTTVNTMKRTINSPRPDGSDNRSFPSGHTAMAFMTATMLNKEYGHLSPWVGIGAYTAATTTGLMRIANNKHWLSDVLVGAGIGILSVEFGYWIADILCKDKGLHIRDTRDSYEVNEYKPSFVGLYMGFNIPLSKYDTSIGKSFKTSKGTTAGLEGAYFFNKHWGLGGRATISNISVIVDKTEALQPTIDYYTMMAGGYFSLPISKRWALGSKLLGGWVNYANFESSTQSVEGNKGWGAGTGISVSYCVKKHLKLKSFLDYSLLPPINEYSKEYLHSMTLGAVVSVCF